MSPVYNDITVLDPCCGMSTSHMACLEARPARDLPFCAQPDKFSFGKHVHIQGPESDIPWIIFKHVTRSTLRTTAQDVRACLKQCMHAVKACMELQSSLAHVVPRPLLWWYGNDTSPENREHIGIVNSSGNTHDNRPTHTDPAPTILTTTRPTTTITPFESGHHQR